MANRSLGTLTIDLVAKFSSFTEGLSKSERAADDWAKSIASKAVALGSSITAIGGAFGAVAVAAGAAALEITKQVSETVTETDRWAKTLGMSTSALQTWQYAATKAGLSADNMADIFKDLGDKIGDAVLNKSGAAAQALDTLGLSAKKLQNYTPDKQLLAIAQAMQGMNVAQKTNIFESLGNDLTKLSPLLANGAKGIEDLAAKGKELGVILPDSANDNLVKFNGLMQDITDSVSGLKNQIAAGLATVDLSGLTKSFDDLRKTIADPNILQALADIATGIVNIGTALVKTIGKAADFVSLIMEIPDRFKAGGWLKYDEQQRPLTAARTLAADMDAVNPAIQAPAKAAIALPKGQTNGKPPAAKKDPLDSSYQNRLLDLQRQAALIDVTGNKQAKATELAKVNFDIANGNLKKLNASQKANLQNAARQVDSLNAEKKAHEENAKALAFYTNLQKEQANATASNNNSFIGLGQGDKARGRLQEMSSIRQSFADKQSDLQKQYNSGDISSDLYDKETSELQNALATRLQSQQDYYTQLDKLNSDWQDGVTDGLQNYVDNNSNYMQQAADATTSILGSATSALSDNLYSLVTGAETIGQAFKNVGQEILQSVVKALAQMAAQWLVNQAVMLAMGGTATTAGVAQAEALSIAWAPAAVSASIATLGTASAVGAASYGSAIAAGTALSGMAHDGIDAVPETGTWLLQKGERVTTASTSAKLDATLDRVSQSSSAGTSTTYAPTIPINVNGNPSDATIALMRTAVEEGANKGYNRAVQSAASGTGDLHKAIQGGYNVKRRAG